MADRKNKLTATQAAHLRITLHGIRDEVFGGNIEQAREAFRALEREFLNEGVFIHRTKEFTDFAFEPDSLKMLAIFDQLYKEQEKERRRGQKA